MLLSHVSAFVQYIDHDLPAEPAVKTCIVLDDTVHIPQNLSINSIEGI